MSSVAITPEFLALFSDVFTGRHDVYAVGKPHHIPEKRALGKLEYFKVVENLTPEVLKQHLLGNQRVGIYPLMDGYVRWFAVDFDAPKRVMPDGSKVEVEDPFPEAWAEAEKQAQAFEEAGLFVYLERSRSGKGVHCWGFFDEPVEARTVLRALKPLLLDASSYDRMYPVQSQVEEGGYGNLIALPFNGVSMKDDFNVFLNRDTMEPIDPAAFLQTVQFNNRYVIEELAENAPKDKPSSSVGDSTFDERDYNPSFDGRPPRPIRGFFKMISEYGCRFMHLFATKPDDPTIRTQQSWWVAVGQTTCFKNGRDAAHLLSQLSPKYSAQETDELYDRISQETPHGCAYIHANFPHMACSGCPMKAPYHVAQKPILALCAESAQPLAKPNWKSALSRIKARDNGTSKTGRKWHTAGLDKHTRLRPADFVVIGARPSVGKTAFMVDAAINIAVHEKMPVFVFSGETGEISLMDRFVARMAHVDSLLLRGEGVRKLTKDEWERVEQAIQDLESLPIYINYSATRADQILDLIEDTILENRIPLDQPYVVFQDYIQFGNPTDGGASEEYGRITKVSAEFKFVAKILQTTFITFSQLKRDSEGDEKPDLDAFKGSGRIEEAADVAMVLSGERTSGSVAQRWLHGLKQREGAVGWSIKLLLYQAFCHFDPMDDTADQKAEQKDDLFAEAPDAIYTLTGA